MFGAILLAAYALVVILPLVIIVVMTAAGEHGPTYEIGRSLALVAAVVIFLQALQASRLKWMERPFGLDILIRFHKAMGIFAAALLLIHPFLLAAGGAGWSLIFSLDLPWYIWVGKGVLVILIVHMALGMWWERLGMTFETWRATHATTAPLIIAGAFVHSWVVGDDLQSLPFQALWIILLVVALSAYAYRKIIKPAALAREPYEVTDVVRESDDVWTVKLAPEGGGRPYSYVPGQFHFITFQRGRGLPEEEHHWTISSSPTTTDWVSSTIKESGDFTSTIRETKPGDKALVEGPFGRFSYVFHPEDANLVFIAGGIGITPLMAMLRHMRDTGSDLPVLLIYANRSDDNIVFREELDEIAKGGRPRLRVIHVIANPSGEWTGEKGYVDDEKLRGFLDGEFAGKAYYVCCPPIMADKLIEALRGFGVSYDQIRTERFSL